MDFLALSRMVLAALILVSAAAMGAELRPFRLPESSAPPRAYPTLPPPHAGQRPEGRAPPTRRPPPGRYDDPPPRRAPYGARPSPRDRDDRRRPPPRQDDDWRQRLEHKNDEIDRLLRDLQ